MKIATNSNSPIEVSGGESSTSFSIAMNGKAFRVLSNTLYQNKIGSIVRELSCNAVDSHVMAGCADTPIQIHLPDAFEPWFSVTDTGVGLSPEDITTVFSVYFASTKADSNDAIGAFGLGAKTPFAYTDQFTVASVYDGVRTIYSAYLTDGGVPDIKKMFSEPTTDPTGVEIKLSVKREDYHSFASETATQLRFFKIKPVLINNAFNCTYDDIADDIAIDTDNFTLTNAQPRWNAPATFIVQGGVGYPLDSDQVQDSDITSADNKNFLRQVLSGSIAHLKFEIGEIGVTASREGIEYDTHTLTNINAKLEAIRDEITDHVAAIFDNAESDWERICMFNDNHALQRLVKSSKYTLSNGDEFFSHYNYAKALRDDNDKIVGTVREWNDEGKFMTARIFSVMPSNKTRILFVLRDTANRPNIRIKNLLASEQWDKVIEIQLFVGEFTDKWVANLKTLIGDYGNIEFVSKLPLPEKNSVIAKKIVKDYTSPTYWESSNYASSVSKWATQYTDLDDISTRRVYVVVHARKIAKDSDSALLGRLHFAPKEYRLPIVGIREKDLGTVENNKNFVSLSDYVAEVESKVMADNSKKRWHRGTVARSLDILRYTRFSYGDDRKTQPTVLLEKAALGVLEKIAPDSKITKLAKLLQLAHIDDTEYETLTKLAQFMGWPVSPRYSTLARANRRVESCMERILAKYPLLTNNLTNVNIIGEVARYVASK